MQTSKLRFFLFHFPISLLSWSVLAEIHSSHNKTKDLKNQRSCILLSKDLPIPILKKKQNLEESEDFAKCKAFDLREQWNLRFLNLEFLLLQWNENENEKEKRKRERKEEPELRSNEMPSRPFKTSFYTLQFCSQLSVSVCFICLIFL